MVAVDGDVVGRMIVGRGFRYANSGACRGVVLCCRKVQMFVVGRARCGGRLQAETYLLDSVHDGGSGNTREWSGVEL